MGMPRRIFTFLPGQGLELGNLISSIGATGMALGTIVLLINVVKTVVKGERVGNDPWGTGRTLEWSISSPAPEYNFKQTPLVRGLDALWVEKMEGRNEMTPAEPVGDIHMPNPSILPFVMSVGFFIAAFGFMYANIQGDTTNVPALIVGIVGMLILLGSMFLRSVIDDHGFHIHKEDLENDDKGVKG
jgi:cytochrome c oxidase subunit 1